MTEAIEQSEEELYLQMKSDFVYFWCKEYGLPDIIALYLDRKLVTDGESLLRLPRKGIDRNVLSPGEVHLFRGALQQYALHQSTVDDIVNEKATEKRDEMLQRAQNALHGAKPEEKEVGKQLAEKILKCPSISQYILERNRRKAREKELQAQYEAQIDGQLPLAQRILKRRQKMGIETRSISAPASNYEQYLPNDKHDSISAKSTPARLRLPMLNDRQKSPKGRDTPSYIDGSDTPLPINSNDSTSYSKLKGIMSRRNRVDSISSIDTTLPNEVVYKEAEDDEDNNNNTSKKHSKSRKKKKKKKDKEEDKKSNDETTVTVICEIHDRPPSLMGRERSFTNPERMKSSKQKKLLNRNKSNE